MKERDAVIDGAQRFLTGQSTRPSVTQTSKMQKQRTQETVCQLCCWAILTVYDPGWRNHHLDVVLYICSQCLRSFSF